MVTSPRAPDLNAEGRLAFLVNGHGNTPSLTLALLRCTCLVLPCPHRIGSGVNAGYSFNGYRNGP